MCQMLYCNGIHFHKVTFVNQSLISEMMRKLLLLS